MSELVIAELFRRPCVCESHVYALVWLAIEPIQHLVKRPLLPFLGPTDELASQRFDLLGTLSEHTTQGIAE
jgi:hypothetical protein